MKKICLLLMAMVMSFGFVSCGDDKSDSGAPYVGEWFMSEDNSDALVVINIKSNGQWDQIVYFEEDGQVYYEKASGTYQVDGSKMFISSSLGLERTGTWTVASSSAGTILTLSFNGETKYLLNMTSDIRSEINSWHAVPYPYTAK